MPLPAGQTHQPRRGDGMQPRAQALGKRWKRPKPRRGERFQEKLMPKKPTAEDAQIIMKLYDLRREAEMRKARNWFAGFWPRSAEDVVQVINARGTQENAWFRQATTYWEMAASFVLRGAVSEELFFD